MCEALGVCEAPGVCEVLGVCVRPWMCASTGGKMGLCHSIEVEVQMSLSAA